RSDGDLVLARQRARRIAALLGFDTQDQTRIATAVSEIVRNALQYAGGGRAKFAVDQEVPSLVVTISDEGPGIDHLPDILDGSYRSSTGMGMGLVGARRLCDRFAVQSRPDGTAVVLGKVLPRSAEGDLSSIVARIVARLAEERPSDPIAEIQQQNQELLRT